MPTAANLQSDLANARTHILASEWDDALVDLLAAETSLAGLPNTEWANWRESIDRLYSLIKQRRAEADTDHIPTRMQSVRGGRP